MRKPDLIKKKKKKPYYIELKYAYIIINIYF